MDVSTNNITIRDWQLNRQVEFVRRTGRWYVRWKRLREVAKERGREEVKTVVVIPSYWGRPSNEPFDTADTIYDHPTPLDREGTLARALESFKISNSKDFEIIVLGAATNQIFEKQVERRVREIAAGYEKDLPISVMSHGFCDRLKDAVGSQDEGPASLVSLYGYSNIRNFCMIAAEMHGADVIVLFDDDEVVEDPDYLSKCVEHIGKKNGGKEIKGIAGWYKRPTGGYLCPTTRDWWWMEWCGSEAMNEAFKLYIGRGPRIKRTPFAFGGNMVMHKEIFNRIPFDPKITRGEDIDYLFNAKMFGYDFYLDNELWIRHLPPSGHTPDWMGFRQNVLRFTYARQKLISQVEIDGMFVVKVEDVDPYPGCFMRDDLDRKIFNTSSMLGLHYLLEKDDEGYTESMRNIELAKQLIRDEKDPIGDYLRLKENWEKLMNTLPSLRNHVDLLVE